jgi:LysR family pca operon transcriptional activator
MIDTRIKFRHLHTFLEVARQQSVVRAAEILNISQPAVTKTIRELEDVLGVAVIERNGRGIRITHYGEVFLKHAGASLSALRQGIDSVSQELFSTAPPVQVGALPTVSNRIMPRAMALFLLETPGARVKIVTGDNAVLMEQLQLGELDLVVGRLAPAEKMTGLSFEHLYSEQVVFVTRIGHPLLEAKPTVFDNLQNFPVLIPTKSSIIRRSVEQFLIANGIASLPTQIETVSDSFGRAFVQLSDAIWIISAGVVAEDIKQGLLAILPMDTSETKGPVGLTIKADTVPSAPLSILMRTIRQAATEIMPGG